MVHVRRDFLNAARSWPTEEGWASSWVQRIGQLYHLHCERSEVVDRPEAFAGKDAPLLQHVEGMKQQAQKELSEPVIHPALRKVLSSL